MKIFSKFKQLKREIKLVIITVLIASCIGVYATGECIISATADDVAYNNTTVQAAIDDLFSMSENYCPPGYECKPRTMYSIMAKNSVLDNISSTYVTSSTGIDFSQISSDTNGKGLYKIASTANDPYPIYYYRGAVDNNNVKFAGFCWKAIRTTDTGGVKLIYNGEPDQDGYCTNTTGQSTQIGASNYNSSSNSATYIGYMYGTVYSYAYKQANDLANSYIYGNDVSYSNGTYTLQDTFTSSGNWGADYSRLYNKHYTCFSSSDSCSTIYFVYSINYQSPGTGQWNFAIYITLTNGKTVEDALEEMFINTTDSLAKTTIDTWYSNNLLSYSSYIEDTVYCNDRSINNLGGMNPNSGSLLMSGNMEFGPYYRLVHSSPSLVCSRDLDKFTVSSSIGNGELTYPIGLITVDEAMYAGAIKNTNNTSYYLYTNTTYYSMSPYYLSGWTLYDSDISSQGYIMGAEISSYGGYSIRPVISLKSTDIVMSGNGTSTNPYVIKTN